MSNLKKKLAAAKNAFAKARKNVEENPQGSGEFFDEVGRFDTQVSGGEVNESQNGRLQAYIEFTILDGEYKGETFRSYYGLDKDVSIEILLKDIARLGFDVPEDIEEVEDKLEEIVKAKPKIKIKRVQKGEYVNNYLQKLMDGDDGEGGAESSGGDDAQTTEAAPDFTPEAGAEVTTPDGDGTVKSVDEDDKDAVVKLESGEKKTYPWTDLKPKEEAAAEAETAPEEAPAEEGGGDIEVGQVLHVEDKKQKLDGLGKVTKLHADEGEVSIKMEKTGKVVRVGVDALSLPPKPAPAKKAMRVGKK